MLGPGYLWRFEIDKKDLRLGWAQLFEAKALLPSGLNAGTTKEAWEIDTDGPWGLLMAFLGA